LSKIRVLCLSGYRLRNTESKQLSAKGEANSGGVCSVIDAEALLKTQTQSASKTLPWNQ
jgi:hypothetical protein